MSDYMWEGDYQCPGVGQYVVFKGNRELEPAEVVDLLRCYDELVEQVRRTTEMIQAAERKTKEMEREVGDLLGELDY